jgi:trehalose/maltose hydrolase-like predicted phosphorylase
MDSFTGVSLFRDHIRLDPELPDGWTRTAFTMRHRGQRFVIEVAREEERSVAYVTRTHGDGEELTAQLHGRVFRLPVGERVRIAGL